MKNYWAKIAMTQSRIRPSEFSHMGQKMKYWLETNQLLIIVRYYILIALQKKSMQNIDFLAKYYQKTNKLSKYTVDVV